MLSLVSANRDAKIAFLCLSLMVGALPMNHSALASSQTQLARHQFRIAAGQEGGTYLAVAREAEKLTAKDSLSVRAVATEGSWQNLELLSDEGVQMAFTQRDAAMQWAKEHPYDTLKTSLLYTEYLHILVRNPLELPNVVSFRQKRISTGSQGSGTNVTARVLLDLMGISPGEYIGSSDLDRQAVCRLLRHDSLDIVMYVGARGNSWVQYVLDSADVHLMSLDVNAIRRITLEAGREQSGLIGVKAIPVDTYSRQEHFISAVAVPVLLAITPGIPENIYKHLRSVIAAAVDTVGVRGKHGVLAKPEDESPPPATLKYWLNILGFGLAVLLAAFLGIRYSTRILRFCRVRLILIVALVTFAIYLGCAVGIYSLEHSVNQNFESLYETIWSMFIYVTSGLENRSPFTPVGRFLALIMLVMGSVFLAALAGFFASSIILNALEKGMTHNLKNHYVILNWGSHSLEVIKQIHAPELKAKSHSVVVVMSDDPQLNLDELQKRFNEKSSKSAFEDVYFYPGNPCDVTSLENANVQDSRTVVVMADEKLRRLSDEKAIRSLLSIQQVAELHKRNLHVVVELECVNRNETSCFMIRLPAGPVAVC